MKTSQLGFMTFGLTYVVFLCLEYLRPGFVAHVFSVHWLLVVTAVFGAVWFRSSSVNRGGSWAVAVAGIIGLLAAIIVWTEGGVFGDARLFISVAVLCLPALALMSFRDTT